MDTLIAAPIVDLDGGQLRPNTVIRREYKGVEHVVEIVDQPSGAFGAKARRRGWFRYMYNGQRWKSLSAIAYEITGDRMMSGNRFFGLRQPRGVACTMLAEMRRWD